MKKILTILLSILFLTFTACFSTNNSSGDSNNSGNNNNNGGDVVQPQKYTISFMVNGSIYHTVETVGNEQIVMPNEPSVSGYEFEGWFLDEEFSLEFTKDYFVTNKIESDVSIFAKFTIIPVYANEYSFDDRYHWRAEVGGEGKIDYDTHSDIGGKCEVCDYYYDSSEALTYELVTYDGVEGYEVTQYDKTMGILHVEVPTYYDGVPVISIAAYAFQNSPLESIKLNEGLIYIGRDTFRGTMIEEFIMPSTVLGMQPGSYPNYVNGMNNTFTSCVNLKRVVLNDNIKTIGGYVFGSCKVLEEVILGKNVESIRTRAFYECKELKSIVIPAKVNYMPESEIYSNAVKKKVTLNRYLFYAEEAFLEMTREEYESRLVPLYERDMLTGEIIPDDIVRNPGICEGWEGIADLYFAGEWHYDENGKPVPND